HQRTHGQRADPFADRVAWAYASRDRKQGVWGNIANGYGSAELANRDVGPKKAQCQNYCIEHKGRGVTLAIHTSPPDKSAFIHGF
ncbi:MAG TPA: hypothetical protein VMW24_27670, partial [Sedimentisphaerales bacterium]|nr:hypothetical protein [Sedimentisphaerales bacterium]